MVNVSGNSSIYDFTITRFDIKNKLKSGDLIILVGRKNTGKTVTIRDIMYNLQDIPVPLVFNPSETANRLYSYHVPKTCIVEDLNLIEERLGRLFERQTLMFNKCLEDFVEQGHDIDDSTDDFKAFVYSDACKYDPRVLVIMDDCMFDKKKWSNSPLIRKIFFNGRHYFITFVIAMQYTLGVTPEMRAQIEHIFLMDEKSPQIRKKNYDAFGGPMPWAQFNDLMSAVIKEKGECLVVEGTGTGEYDETYFHYRSPLNHGRFRIGATELWDAEEKARRTNGVNSIYAPASNPTLTPSTISMSKKKPVIINVFKREDR